MRKLFKPSSKKKTLDTISVKAFHIVLRIISYFRETNVVTMSSGKQYSSRERSRESCIACKWFLITQAAHASRYPEPLRRLRRSLPQLTPHYALICGRNRLNYLHRVSRAQKSVRGCKCGDKSAPGRQR